MNLSAYRRFLHPVTGSLIAGVAVASIVLAVVVAHNGPVAHEMGDDSMKAHEAISICLAIMQAGGSILVGFLLRGTRRQRPALMPLAPSVGGTSVRTARVNSGSRIREGPACQQVFRN